MFQNQTLREIHDKLLAEGLLDQDALKAAAAFEEISIVDLEREISATRAEESGSSTRDCWPVPESICAHT